MLEERSNGSVYQGDVQPIVNTLRSFISKGTDSKNAKKRQPYGDRIGAKNCKAGEACSSYV